jgi:putative aminopeptidase FrvX
VDERQLAFLRDLTGAPGPSGYEGPVRAIWRASAQEFATETYADVHGSVSAVVHPNGAPRVMLAGHIDEIGLMVSNIDDQGFLYFVPIGGHDAAILVGQRVQVHGRGGPILGVLGRKPIHLIKADDRKAAVEIASLWIDIGATDRKDAESVVRIGDAVTMIGSLDHLRGDFLVSKAFDDRVGAYVAAEAARAVAAGPTRAAVYAVGTCQEEIGYRGAITSAERIKPDVAIAIDVGFGLDHPGVEDERKRRNAIALGKGPLIARGANINSIVFEQLVAAAEAEKIPYQIDPTPGESGTDSWAIQVAHHGVATGLISVPVRYMHTPVEVLSTADVDWAVALLAAFIRRLVPDANGFVEP